MSGDIDVEVTEIRAMTLTAYKLAILNRASNELAADGLSFEQQLEGAIAILRVSSVRWLAEPKLTEGERRLAERVGFVSTYNAGSRMISMDLGQQKL